MNHAFSELPAVTEKQWAEWIAADPPPLSADQWSNWLERWISKEFPWPRQLTYLVLYDENGHEWFLKWAGQPHVMDDEGSGVCDDCNRRSFVWAQNLFLGRKCLLCFKRGVAAPLWPALGADEP